MASAYIDSKVSIAELNHGKMHDILHCSVFLYQTSPFNLPIIANVSSIKNGYEDNTQNTSTVGPMEDAENEM